MVEKAEKSKTADTDNYVYKHEKNKCPSSKIKNEIEIPENNDKNKYICPKNTGSSGVIYHNMSIYLISATGPSIRVSHVRNTGISGRHTISFLLVIV